MNAVLRKAMLLACGGVLVASSAMAAVPSPADSDVPNGMNLVGTAGGVADVRGEFSITIRDLAHNPIAGSSVVISFDGCTPDIRLCASQVTAGVTPDCASGAVGEVSGVTDGTGVVTFRVQGGANNTASGTPAAAFNCGVVYADGVNMGPINVGAYDQNGAGGVTPPDVSVWLSDSFDGDIEGRSDFNATNTVNPADLSVLLGVVLGGGSTSSCGAYCH
jgi:hypothetical protein